MKIKKLLWGFIFGLGFCVGAVDAAKQKFELPKPKTEAQIRKEPIYKALEAKFQNGVLEISSIGEWESFDLEAVLNLFLHDNSNQVKKLKVNNCEITTINISPCESLEICDLSDNNLREVIGLGSTKKLKKLDLRWNSELKKMPKGLEDLDELVDFKIGFDDLLKSEKVIALAVFDTVRNKQKEEPSEKKEEGLGEGDLEKEIGGFLKRVEELQKKKLEEELKQKTEKERIKREAEAARIKKENEEKEEKKKKADEQKKKEDQEREDLKKQQEVERVKQELEDEQAEEALKKMLEKEAVLIEDEQEEPDDDKAKVLFVKDPLKTKITQLSKAFGVLADRLKLLAKKMAEVKRSIG